jgi:thiamine-phosphate pyrophosphorylase
VRPLPRLFAFTTDTLCRAADFGVRAAAIAAAGPAVALVVRAPGSTTAQHAAFAERVTALARPPEAAVFIHARPDLARAVAATGVHLRGGDLAPRDARRVLGDGWVGCSVHSREEAEAALDEGADYLVAGSVFESASHPGRAPLGLAWLARIAKLGRPVVAIGGITPERAAAVRGAGAWGAAVIAAAWDAADPAAAASALLAPWTEET